MSTFPPSCPANLFRCDNGICIESSRQCDNVNDCFDGSDEKDCGEDNNIINNYNNNNDNKDMHD